MSLGLVDLKIGLRNSLEILDVATWKSDGEGRVIEVSVGLCELLGAAEHDLLDSSWIGLVVPEDRERIFDAWLMSVKTASSYDEEYTYKKPDGSFQKVRGVAIHNKNTKGKITGSLGRLYQIGEPFKK